MKRYLYQDLFELEEVHWWHVSKRSTCLTLIHKYLKSKKNIKILDIGCGTGKNLEEFSNLGEAYGIDISPEAIKFCREKRGLRNITMASAQKTGFINSTFDVVCILDVLEHTDDKKVLEEIKRILNRDGLLILTVPAFNLLWSKWDEVLHHRRRYTKRSLKRILTKEGLEIVMISYMYSFLVLPVIVVRSIKSLLFKEDYPSDFKISNNFINKVMIQVSLIERKIMDKLTIPFGTSIVCVCTKK